MSLVIIMKKQKKYQLLANFEQLSISSISYCYSNKIKQQVLPFSFP